MQHAKAYGLSATGVAADLAAVVARARRGQAAQSGRYASDEEEQGHGPHGHGKLLAPGKLEVTGDKGVETLTAKHIIVATGARARSALRRPMATASGPIAMQ
jgi:dihydrolipoamide dehydrogenase